LVGGQGKVLVMDDEPFIREIAARMLTRLGYTVEVAKNGSEAIEMYREAKDSNQAYDVVIMDLTVPGGMGGEEAIGHLKEIDPDVKALVSSGYSNSPVMSNFKDCGFQGVITKPYTVQDVSRTLQMLITAGNDIEAIRRQVHDS
jgi:CheY-like chemotaxis protein